MGRGGKGKDGGKNVENAKEIGDDSRKVIRAERCQKLHAACARYELYEPRVSRSSDGVFALSYTALDAQMPGRLYLRKCGFAGLATLFDLKFPAHLAAACVYTGSACQLQGEVSNPAGRDDAHGNTKAATCLPRRND